MFIYILNYFLKRPPFRGVRGGVRAPRPPTPTRASSEGGTHGGGSFNITSSSGNKFYIALHCTHPRLRQEIKYIPYHNNNHESFVLPSIALKIHVSHFEN